MQENLKSGSTDPTDPPATPGNGDIDADGKLTVSDVIVMQKYLLGIHALTETEAAAADVTGDGDIDIFDLGMMKNMLLVLE